MTVHLEGEEVTEQIALGTPIKLGKLTFVCMKSALEVNPITDEMVQNLEFKHV